MSFSRYEAQKDSGVEWLGEVPTHWEVKQLRYVGLAMNGLTYDPADIVAQEGGTLVLRSSNVQGGVIILEDSVYVRSNIPERLRTRIEDILICSRNGSRALIGKNAPITRASEGMTFGAFMMIFRSKFHNFLRFVFNSELFAYQSALFLTSTINQLTMDNLYSFKVPLPPQSEQDAIATFLDRETAKIDALVEEQQRLIALLREKRQAVISHAVTKGLDPKAPMKDSGVEWLGEVPAHWEIVPVGYKYEVQLGRMLNEERSLGEHLRPYLRVYDVQWGVINIEDLPLMDFPPEAQARYRLQSGDLLVNEGGSYVGRSAIWRGDLEECYYQKALHRLRPRDNFNDTSEFFLYVMEMATQRGVFVAGGNQTTIDHLTAEQLRRYRFAFPPLNEQFQIAEFLVGKLDELHALLNEAEAAIALLQERRSALISAAVTGKIDVRGLACLAVEAA